jgi:hypothetical protein
MGLGLRVFNRAWGLDRILGENSRSIPRIVIESDRVISDAWEKPHTKIGLT